MSYGTTAVGDCIRQDQQLVFSQLALLNDQEYSDITVTCRDEVWHCHRAILFQRCPTLKNFTQTEGNQKIIILTDDLGSEVDLLLRYIYTLQIPSFLPNNDCVDSEAERNKMWIDAAHAYRNGTKYRLETLKNAGLKAIMFLGPQIFKNWDSLGERTQQFRMGPIFDVYNGWDGPENEMGEVRWAVLKGLVRQAHKIADSPFLHELLRMNQAFMLDYIWALSRKLGKRRRARFPATGERGRPIVIS